MIRTEDDVRVNLSPFGTAKQSSTYKNKAEYAASLAITGGPTNNFSSGSCSHTGENQQPAWWMLTLPNNSLFVEQVKIFYRSTTPYRLDGYSLYVSNTSISGNPLGFLCYKDSVDGNASINQTVACNQMGQYVILYNDHRASGDTKGPFLELCDVQVIGCSKQRFGKQCGTMCSPKCFGQNCYPSNGTCVFGCNCLGDNCDGNVSCNTGCKSGFTGHYCDEQCSSPNFGHNCLQKCHCKNQQTGCDSEDGTCPAGGCQDGWIGTSCSTACEQGHYGFNCSELCYGCLSKLCNKTTGECFNATHCNPGWEANSPFCNTVCPFPTFGESCRHSCHCRNQSLGCNHIDGRCNVEGCEKGWYGSNCSTACEQGHYGFNCSELCDGCLSKLCNKTTGECFNATHCNPGWEANSPFCNTVCPFPTFGESCRHSCHCRNQSLGCNHIDGRCNVEGCEKGWYGSNCSTACEQGHYGFNCSELCDGCLSKLCNKTTGECFNATHCNPGWEAYSPFCNTVCPFPTFGESCMHSCHCRNQSLGCNHIDGRCNVEGCEKGWYGSNCSTECQDGTFGFDCQGNCSHCVNNTCDKIKGDCISGCVEGYNEGSCAKIAQQDQEGKVDSTGTIAGVGVAAVAIIIIAVILIIFYLRRRMNKADSTNNFSSIQRHNLSSRNKTDGSKYSDEHNYVNLQPRTSTSEDKVTLQEPDEGNLNTSYQDDDDNVVYKNANVDEKYTDHNIAIDDLARCINEKLVDNRFETEYESLPKGHVYPHIEGTREKNKLKNRFLTTWPYDHSRVVLRGDKSSDYINASYIDNYSKEKAYIATQGPKTNTIKDFWQMIWQEEVQVIVMVTQLEESGRKKCQQYWPELQDKCMGIGHFEISVCKETSRTIYVKRVFTLLNKKNNNERTIHQFHFTQWPDHGVPDIIKLVDFYRKVKKESDHYDVLMVVHCSAGIGRTGTFLAIDALYEHSQRTGFINVMEYAQMMRKDRMNMIQTKDQYQTVFEALLELLTVPDTSLAREDFSKVIEIDQNQHVPKNQTKLFLEFQRLKTLKPIYFESSYSTASSEENRAKNCNSILAHDKYRPILMSTEKDRNNYINAVILPEYTSKNQIIVTQYPLKDTVVDFWTLIYDHHCSVVVMLEKPSSENPLWSKTDTPFNVKMFTVQTLKEGSEVNIKLTNKTNSEERHVSVYQMDEWTSDDLPSSSSSILDLISNVSQKRERNRVSLAVVDRDGASRSGLFVALTLILQKLQMDDEVDIFQVVRMMQVRRPEFLTNVVQYEYCYQCVKEYLDRESLYANT